MAHDHHMEAPSEMSPAAKTSFPKFSPMPGRAMALRRALYCALALFCAFFISRQAAACQDPAPTAAPEAHHLAGASARHAHASAPAPAVAEPAGMPCQENHSSGACAGFGCLCSGACGCGCAQACGDLDGAAFCPAASDFPRERPGAPPDAFFPPEDPPPKA